jgi:hypothetical protein
MGGGAERGCGWDEQCAPIEHHSNQVERLRAVRLSEGEARGPTVEVGMEGDEVTLPVGEPMTATTL